MSYHYTINLFKPMSDYSSTPRQIFTLHPDKRYYSYVDSKFEEQDKVVYGQSYLTAVDYASFLQSFIDREAKRNDY